MDRDLMGSMKLTVPVVGELAQIEENMEVFGGETGKELLDLSAEDRHELAALFLVKGGMSGIAKKAKEMEEKAKEVGSPWMLARTVKTVKVKGIGTFSLTEGKSTSISADNLRKVLLGHVSASAVNSIVEKATKTTTYTTLQFKPVTVREK